MFSGDQVVFCRIVYTAQLKVSPFNAFWAAAMACALAVVLGVK
jgi:hypothetical protein